jgi:prolyl oligopeptidase
VGVSADGRWLWVSAAAGTDRARELWLADLAAGPPEAPRLERVPQPRPARSHLVIPASAGATGSTAGSAAIPVCGSAATPVRGSAATAYLSTDLDAPRGRLAAADPTAPSAERWRTLVPEDPDSVLEDFVLLSCGAFDDRPILVVSRTRHAVGEAALHDAADGRHISTLPLPPGGTVGPLRAAADGGHEAWFSHASFTEPPVVYRYDLHANTTTCWPGPRRGHSGALEPAGDAPDQDLPSPPLETRQLAVTSLDGTKVRMFVIARPDVFAAAGRRPVPALLTAYGGFGQSSVPAYSPEIVAWAQAGGVYAVANIRGGGEEGEQWHRAGMREHKQRCFEDFEAAADRLVADGLTVPEKLGIWGASNGGLLTGAALTRRPRGYGAVACVAPLLDMARYERSGLGPSWTGEYGTASDPDQLAWLLAYSPYHHVRQGEQYPATMFAVFDGDSRVDPLHARKMCAALQDATAAEAPILYRLERGAGHGARSTSRRTALFADLLAFFAEHLGL